MSIEGIIGTVLGILGVATGYIFYRKSLRLREPWWAIRSNNIIQDNVSKNNDITVLYKGQKVENLTISKVLLWNEGAETIDRQNIMTANPIRLLGINGSTILDAIVLSTNHPSSQFSLQLDITNNTAHINFDYLDQGHGAVIQIVHTGNSSKDIDMVGDIKGVKQLKKRTMPSRLDRPRYRTRGNAKKIGKAVFFLGLLFGSLYGFLGSIFLLFPSTIFFLVSRSDPSYSESSRLLLIALLISGSITFFWMVFILRKRLAPPPKGLEIFEEDIL